MPITLGSNIAALSAQRRLNEASTGLGAVFERLSSGARINRASDDAAGLAIADTLRVNTRLHTTAIRNINDGISALTIADEALSAQSGVLMRLSELAEQAANGSLSSKQRSSLNVEYQQLVAEFGRIGATTTFNRNNLLLGTRDGSGSQLAIQAGIDASGNSRIGIEKSDTGYLSGTFNLSSLLTSSLAATIDWLTNHFGQTEWSTEELNSYFGSSSIRTQGQDNNGVTRDVLVGALGSVGGGILLLSFTKSLTNPDVWELEIDSMQTDEAIAGGNLRYDQNGRITTGGGIVSLVAGSGTPVNFSLDLRGLTIAGSDASYGVIGGNSASSAIELSNVSTQSNARSALDVTKARLNELSTMRSNLGATSSRLLTARGINETMRQYTAEAESRIRDVDVATEVSKLVSLKIRQQLASSILGQANQESRLALTLLQG